MIEKIELDIKGFYDLDFEDDCNKILEISKQLEKIINTFIGVLDINLTEEDFANIFYNINQVLLKWSRSARVGRKKEKILENSFQNFYENLYKFLVCGRYFSSELNKLANKVLYKGTLYRILGHPTSDKCNKQIEPEFNNIWVSWSKEDVSKNHYFNEKLYGAKTLLICEVDTPLGIDLVSWDDFFGTNIVNPNESEVVYPTLKESIKNIKYIK